MKKIHHRSSRGEIGDKRLTKRIGWIAGLLLFWATTNAPALGATYYMSPTGDDSSDGLTQDSSWLTPNHALNCGDVIMREAGNYDAGNFGAGKWGVVHNCPSADGRYFAQLLCAGPYVTSCAINAKIEGVRVDKSNWAVIGGFYASSGGGCLWAAPTSAATIHHIAFVNVVASGCQYNGVAASVFAGNPAYAVDQFAVVGAVVYNAAQGSLECFAGVSDYDPSNFDETPGTHVFIAGVFSYSNIDPVGCANNLNSDGEGIIFDNWSNSQNSGIPYSGQGVVEQSMLLGNGGAGFEAGQTTVSPVVITSTTIYGNAQFSAMAGTWRGELFLNSSPGPISAKGNIVQATVEKQNGRRNYAVFNGGGSARNVVSDNFLLGVAGNHTNARRSGEFAFGPNIYADPKFLNPLVPAAPDCSSAETTTACMASVIAYFTPQAPEARGYGYQPPGKCAPDPYFPIWLKGVIPAGIITKPCDM